MKNILLYLFVLLFMAQCVFAERIQKSFHKDAVNNAVAINAKTEDGSKVKIMVHKKELIEDGQIKEYLFPPHMNIDENEYTNIKDVVTIFRVQVNGKDVFIPAEERLALCNVNGIHFESMSKERFKVGIIGGDAATSYENVLYFGMQEGEIRVYRSEHGGGECCEKPTVIEYQPCICR